jgi:hypothetical protein
MRIWNAQASLHNGRSELVGLEVAGRPHSFQLIDFIIVQLDLQFLSEPSGKRESPPIPR